MNYFLYAKTPESRTFHAINWKHGIPVRRLINATMFTPDQAILVLEEARRLNPETTFKLRKFK